MIFAFKSTLSEIAITIVAHVGLLFTWHIASHSLLAVFLYPYVLDVSLVNSE